MDFNEAEQKRIQFLTRLRSGQLTPPQFAKAVTSLQVTDARGTIWQPNPSGEGWIFWTGSAWQPGMPPGMPGPGRATGTGGQKSAKDFNEFKSSLMSVDEFKKMSKDVPLAKRPQKWWDLLSILGGVVAAIIWFLYGGIRSGREGFDLITPLLMIAIPVILVWFRADIDQILLPLQPHRKKIPRLVLIGLGIAVPFVTAWILYNLVHISQYPLMQANLVIGVVASYALVRDPVPAQGKITQRSGPLSPASASIIFFVMLASLLAVPVMADDCSSDFLNAQDCLRTNGFAETMAGATAAGLGVLVNGPIILGGILSGGSGAAGAAGGAGGAGSGAGSGGSSGGSGKIYGTGTKGDPFRDGNTLGEIGPDGKFVPYPENAGQPPKIFGDGTKQNPYSDSPPPVFDPTPTPPDIPPPPPEPPVAPTPPPTGPQMPVGPHSPQPPVGPQPPVPPVQPPVPPVQPPVPPVQPPVPPVQPPVPPVQPPVPPVQPPVPPVQPPVPPVQPPVPPVQPPVPPVQPPVPPVQPPVPPVQPPVPPVQPPVPPVQPPVPPVQPPVPPVPPQPPTLTPAQRQALLDQRTRILDAQTALRAKWQRRRWLENTGIPTALKVRTFQWLRTFAKTGKDAVEAITDPKGKIYDETKKNLGIKTPLDKAKEGLFGKEVETKAILKEFQEADAKLRELQNELKGMPSEEKMLEDMKALNHQFANVDGKLQAGGK